MLPSPNFCAAANNTNSSSSENHNVARLPNQSNWMSGGQPSHYGQHQQRGSAYGTYFQTQSPSSAGGEYQQQRFQQAPAQHQHQPNFRGTGYSNYNSKFGNNNGPRSNRITCDACDQTFFNDAQLKSHLAEHVTCGLEGCAFQAHYKIVLKHQNDQHFNLKSLAEKLIKLETPEDIAKWREQRRKNFPTVEKSLQKKVVLVANRAPRNNGASNVRQQQQHQTQNNRGNRFESRGKNRERPYGKGSWNKNEGRPFPKWTDRNNHSAVTNNDIHFREPSAAPAELIASVQNVEESIEREEGELSDDGDESGKIADLQTGAAAAPFTSEADQEKKPQQGTPVQVPSPATIKTLVADYSESEDEVADSIHSSALVDKSGSVAEKPANSNDVVPVEKQINGLNTMKNADRNTHNDRKSKPNASMSGPRQPGKMFGPSRNNQRRPYVQKRSLTLFEKLMLNDVRREESKILECIDVLSKVHYEL